MRNIVISVFVHTVLGVCAVVNGVCLENCPTFQDVGDEMGDGSAESLFGTLDGMANDRTHEPAHSLPVARLPIVVFDFGGVIGGTDRTLVAKEIAPVLRLSVEEASHLLTQLRADKERGISSGRFWREYAASAGKSLPDDWDAYFEQVRLVSIRSRPTMVALVDALRKQGYRVAMLSNTTVPRAAFIRRQGVYSHFDPVLLSCEIGVKKPNKKAFTVLLQELGAAANDCLFIDDKAENIEAARRLGMDGILFSSFEELATELEKRSVFVTPA